MKKKTTKEKAALARKQREFKKRFALTDEQYLERLIEVSEKAANSNSESLNELFMDQANRIRKELEELRNK